MRKKFAIGLILTVLMLNMTWGAKIAWAEDNVPLIDGDSAILMDARTGQVLFAKNKDKKEYPASITKVMTGLLALEYADTRAIITMSRQAVFSITRGSSHIALDTDEKLALEDALYALAIESANDTANGIAEYIAGDCEGFAAMMNRRARELGAINTHFANAHGLDDPDHYTTANDMALIMRQAIKVPGFKEIFSANYHKMPPTNLQEMAREFHCKNLFLNGIYDYEGITASKLGWTTNAKNTLVTSASRDGRDLIVVVMNSTAHHGTYLDTMKLFDYGFEEFQEVTVLSAEEEEKLPVAAQSTKNIIVKSDSDITRLLHKNVSADSIQTKYEILDNGDQEGLTAEVSFYLPGNNEYMYRDLGSTTIYTPTMASADALGVTRGDLGPVGAFLLKTIKIIFFLLLVLGILIIILRQINQMRLRRKRSARHYRINYIKNTPEDHYDKYRE